MDDKQTWYVVCCAEMDLFQPAIFRTRKEAERFRKDKAEVEDCQYTFGIIEAEVNFSNVDEMKGWIGE